jgi:hypothetical protein
MTTADQAQPPKSHAARQAQYGAACYASINAVRARAHAAADLAHDPSPMRLIFRAARYGQAA